MKYFNFIRFKPVGAQQPANLYEPAVTEVMHSCFGEKYSTLIPRSDLHGKDYNNTEVVLLVKNPDGSFTIQEAGDKRIQCGTIRQQKSETYTLLRLLVNETPSGTSYKYFSLKRPDGTFVTGTFKSMTANRVDLMQELKEHFEKFTISPVRAEIKGSVIELRMYHTSFFTYWKRSWR